MIYIVNHIFLYYLQTNMITLAIINIICARYFLNNALLSNIINFIYIYISYYNFQVLQTIY